MPTAAETRAHLERIARDGYTILERALEPDLVDALADALLRLERERDVRPAMNGFEGHRTVRIYNLLALDRVFERVPVHPAVLPLALPRFLLYFFYRFETCVREATVLGMLGVVSLGYWIQEARARQTYDELLLFVGLGALLVLAADAVSIAARGWLRRARS